MSADTYGQKVESPPQLALEDATVRAGSGSSARTLVAGMSVRLSGGRVVAMVGESGSGKTLTGLACTGVVPPGLRLTGKLFFGEQDVLQLDEEKIRGWRLANLAYSIQQPSSALYPLSTVGELMKELWLERAAAVRNVENHSAGNAVRSPDELFLAILAKFGFAEPRKILTAYPHELSGGESQRVALALAFAHPGTPAFFVLDEPTENLDNASQKLVQQIILEYKRKGNAFLLITHNLEFVLGMADEIAVVYGGRLVERGSTYQISAAPLHPYTQGLMKVARSVREKPPSDGPLPAIPWESLEPYWAVQGCPYRPRCSSARPVCAETSPPLVRLDDGREVACFLYGP